ncbi:MAG: helix-turn-helix transcriptional regulator [Verrucomicrobiae bacterium]|nr:helix-turn-helix transcriptional regulator [Verrucomicrobiae bacterium]
MATAIPGERNKIITPRVILFPNIRLDEVLQFDDELLLALRATKSWQDPASPAWLGTSLCALAAAIGPMVRLFLPGGLTVAPSFNALIAIPAGGSLEFNRRLLSPLKDIQTRVRNRRSYTLDTLLTSSFEEQELRFRYSRTINGALLIGDRDAFLMDRLLDANEMSQATIAGALQAYVAPKEATNLAGPMWDGTVNMLMAGHRDRLPELASTPLFNAESYPHVLVLPEDFTPYDISPGHELGFMEAGPWNDLVKRVTGFPAFWAMHKNQTINCPTDSATPLEGFKSELEEILKVVHPCYRTYLHWLPDLAASITITICFVRNPEATTIDCETVNHAVTITKWLSNCHFRGLQEILQVEPVPDVSDRPAIPDRPRLILEKLRVKGPMTPREISRSCFQMTASARDHALNWLQERELVVFRRDGLVQAVN